MNSDMLTRITRYYRALNRLRAIGLEKVFAHNLADAAGVNAVIVRKDFSLLGIHGQKRGGYDILPLVTKLGDLLGKGEPQNVIIVGCGRIGKALMHYSGFEPDGIRIVAATEARNSPDAAGESISANTRVAIYMQARSTAPARAKIRFNLFIVKSPSKICRL